MDQVLRVEQKVRFCGHWGALMAADFFTTEVWTLRGLVTYYTESGFTAIRGGGQKRAPTPEERELQPGHACYGLCWSSMKTLFVTGVMTLMASYALAQTSDS